MKRIFVAKIKCFKGVKANGDACDIHMILFITKTGNKWYNSFSGWYCYKEKMDYYCCDNNLTNSAITDNLFGANGNTLSKNLLEDQFMKIIVINGTEIRGCTYNIKEIFLGELREGNELTEFYLPSDLPEFCCGCKTCFFKNEENCPHANYVMPIWNAMLEADLLVFTSPVYALRTTGQMKTLLDHLAVHWMVHRPDERMNTKKAVILTNAIGVFNGGAQKDIKTSLVWLGISHIRGLGIGLLEGIIWEELSDKRREMLTNKIKKLANKYKVMKPARKKLKVATLFAISKSMHKGIAKKESTLSADNQYWVDKGWITGR